MDCEKIKVQLSAYIDGELPEKDATVIREHIAVCADCAQEEQLLRKTSRLLKAWENVPAPAGSCEVLLARAENVSRRPRRNTMGKIPLSDSPNPSSFAQAFSSGGRTPPAFPQYSAGAEKSLIRAVRPLAGPRALVRVTLYGAAVALLCIVVVFLARSPLRRAPMVEPPPTQIESVMQERGADAPRFPPVLGWRRETNDTVQSLESPLKYTTMAEMKVAGIWR